MRRAQASPVEAVWRSRPVWVIRIRFCSWKDRKAVTRALKPIYRGGKAGLETDLVETLLVAGRDQQQGAVKGVLKIPISMRQQRR